MYQRVIASHIITITNEQYNFLPNRSTIDAIIQVLQDWTEAKDQRIKGNQRITAIFFDFAKAFNLVDHQLLLTKLQSHLPPWLISWIATYLSDRFHRVKSNSYTTEWLPVEAVIHVIQGSVIWPILFILIISDINTYISDQTVLEKYAYDILTVIIGEHHPDLPQNIADSVDKWCTDNKMRLNTTICKVNFYTKELVSSKTYFS